MDIKPGQIYESAPDRDKVIRSIRVLAVFPGHASGPKAQVENTIGAPRRRFVALDKLHTDGKPRKAGYRLVNDTDTRALGGEA